MTIEEASGNGTAGIQSAYEYIKNLWEHSDSTWTNASSSNLWKNETVKNVFNRHLLLSTLKQKIFQCCFWKTVIKRRQECEIYFFILGQRKVENSIDKKNVKWYSKSPSTKRWTFCGWQSKIAYKKKIKKLLTKADGCGRINELPQTTTTDVKKVVDKQNELW